MKKMYKKGHIASINISKSKGGKKYAVKQAFINELGLEGDAHSGKWHRQVSMLSIESIKKMNEKKAVALPGDFGENLTVEGIDLRKISIGDIVKIKGKEDVILKVTQIGKECTNPCSIYYDVGYCIMPLEGIFLEVISGGSIRTGDSIVLMIK
jgi:molybdopterin adenylyltransferase